MNLIRIAACSPDAPSMSSPNSWMVSSIRYHAVPPSPAEGGSAPTRTDLSTSRMIVWKMPSASRPAPAQTSWAAPTLKGPANTDSRAHSLRSASVHRS